MNLGKQAKGSVRDPSWIFISHLKSNAKGRAVRTRQSYLGRSVPLAMIVNINEKRVNSVKKCTEKSDSFSKSFGPHDSASKILLIKIN